MLDFLYMEESQRFFLKPVYEACLETEIMCEKMNLELFLSDNIFEDYYTESVQDIFQKAVDFISGIIKRIKESFNKFKTKIAEIFTNKKLEDKINELEQAMKENPQLKDEKVSMPDYEQLEKLRNDIRSDIQKEMSRPTNININPDKSYALEQKMKKYKKQRNKILAASAAVTITLGAALVYLKSSKDKIVDKMTKEHEETINTLEERIKDCEDQAKNAKDALGDQIKINERLNDKVKKQGEEIKKNRNIIGGLNHKLNEANAKTPAAKAKAKAGSALHTFNNDMDRASQKVNDAKAKVSNMTEQAKASATILGDAFSDIMGQARDTVTAVGNASSLKDKKDEAKSGAKKVGKAINNVSSGGSKVSSLEKLYDNLLRKRPMGKEEAKKKREEYNRLAKELKRGSAVERIKKSGEYDRLHKMKDELEEYEKWVKRLSDLKKQLDTAKAEQK